ncbi:uncharacterized protein LOC110443168 [Mizuhopecten yessoensis]|uniref:Protein MB21D2 n=1 Tax=Mizuhopecten yessoensis TaxID=6573 RepID=A0A210PFN0_MIZYE|nr:uncharacterized protein LOC110443168 [Mizuhopecten yessoensis]OWF35267.1 Protein MB21D2 [Mizuhopecten yessoensis]
MLFQNVNDNEKGSINYFEALLDIGKKNATISKENFVLNLILPILPVAESVKESEEMLKEEQSFLFYGRKISCDMQLLVGSSTDGLALPEITHIHRSRSYNEVQDEDILYMFPFLKIDPYHRRAFARPVPISGRHGYVRLKFNSDWLNQRKLYYDHYYMINRSKSSFENGTEFVDSEGFVLRRNLTRKLRKEMRLEIHDKNNEAEFIRINEGRNVSVEYSHHGPALTANVCEETYNFHRSKDYVMALPHPSWPVEAAEWQYRTRTWPPVAVINAAMKGGCHVVPKCHKNSKDPREFILSFGLASRTVAHALSISQFRCYKLFKYLFRFHIDKVKRGLSTFHCKQTMFWLCEKCNQDEWTEYNPFECVQELLRQLEAFLRSHNLPDYFIRENNTIAHISAASVIATTREVTKVREKCLTIILGLTETKRFRWLSRDISLASLLSPCLSADRLTKQTIAVTLLEYVSELLDKSEISMVFYLLGIDMHHEMRMEQFIELVIKRLEQVLMLGLDMNITCCVYGLLASLYHQQAISVQHKPGVGYTLIDKSQHLFDKILSHVDRHIWIYGEYYNLLSTTKQHQLILEHFAAQLLSHTSSRKVMLYQGGIYSSIYFHNRLTMDLCVQQAIVDCRVPSTAFLFFKIIHTLIVLNTNQPGSHPSYHDTAMKALKRFDVWTKSKALRFPELCDEHVQVLLAYSYDCVGSPVGADRYFEKAASFGLDYKDEDESDDLLISTPVIIRLRRIAKEQRTIDNKPYSRPVKQRKGRSANTSLRFGEVQINPFVHG